MGFDPAAMGGDITRGIHAACARQDRRCGDREDAPHSATPDQRAALVLAPDGDGSVEYAELVYASVVEGDALRFRTAPVGFPLPVGRTAGRELLTIEIAQAELSGSVGVTGIVSPVVLEGQLSVSDIVNVATELAGFDEAGTLALLGGVGVRSGGSATVGADRGGAGDRVTESERL